jgi:phosphoribulokinase
MVAVGGDSGTGKTTLCRGLEEIFGSDRILTICLDDYHSLDRAQRKATGITALDPRANNFAAMEEDLATLHDGYPVVKPVYDHHDGTITGPEYVEPRPIVVVQGLFPLYTRTLRSLFDVAVWLNPEDDLKIAWKIQRDSAQRGYTPEQVRVEIDLRQPDIRKHIAPQAHYADVTIEFFRPDGLPCDNAQLNARIIKSGRFKPLDYSEFARSGVLRQVRSAENGVLRTLLELDGACDNTTAQALQDKIWSHMESHAHLRPEALGSFSDAAGRRVSHTLALAQLVVARRMALVENELHMAAAV